MVLVRSIIVVAALQACDRVEYTPVDLQLDILGTFPEDAATLHVCVDGAGEYSRGAGNGQGVFFGLPVGPIVVRLDVLGEDDGVLATAGPVSFDQGETYTTTPLEEGGEACEDDGDIVSDSAASQVLGFRVVEL